MESSRSVLEDLHPCNLFALYRHEFYYTDWKTFEIRSRKWRRKNDVENWILSIYLKRFQKNYRFLMGFLMGLIEHTFNAFAEMWMIILRCGLYLPSERTIKILYSADERECWKPSSRCDDESKNEKHRKWQETNAEKEEDEKCIQE